MKTFNFGYVHRTFGQVKGVASYDSAKDIGDLTKEDIVIKSLTNPIGEMPMSILNDVEIRTAQLHALNHLTVSGKSNE